VAIWLGGMAAILRGHVLKFVPRLACPTVSSNPTAGQADRATKKDRAKPSGPSAKALATNSLSSFMLSFFTCLSINMSSFA
jgi:hypothetical protein